MCQVKSCCCFSLKTGCLIIGVVDIIFYVVIFIKTYIDVSNGDQLECTGVPVLVGSAFSIIAAALLIFGVIKENKGYLRFWLFLKGIALIMIGTIFVWIIIALIVTGALKNIQGLQIALFTAFICIYVAIIGLSIYWWYVVKSYRRELKAKLPL